MRNLKRILRHGFYPRYCPEYTLDPDDRRAAAAGLSPLRAAPMVCFCDLPLSLINKHLAEYGNFGIGVDKDWGRENGAAPVIYTHQNARTLRSISDLSSEASELTTSTARNRRSLLPAYTKPVTGAAWRNNKVAPNVRFYDEREWRYVPDLREAGSIFLPRSDYCNMSKIKALHKRLASRYALRVHPDYISYLILPDLSSIFAADSIRDLSLLVTA